VYIYYSQTAPELGAHVYGRFAVLTVEVERAPACAFTVGALVALAVVQARVGHGARVDRFDAVVSDSSTVRL